VSADDLRLIGSLELFREFSRTEVMMVLMIARTCKYSPGDRIIREGSEGDALYIIKKGRVKVAKYDGRGVERELAFLEEGECFGEVALVDSEPRSASVYAADDCVVYRVGRKEFGDILRHHKELERKFYKTVSGMLARRLRRANEYLTFNLEVGDILADVKKEN